MIAIVPCLSDNYAYLVESGDAIAVVDPGEAEPVLRALGGRKLDEIWATHHHADHTAGIEALCACFEDLRVRTSEVDAARVPGANTPTREGFNFGSERVTVLSTPGHTLGALTYVLTPARKPGAAFTGDTLFSAGCGRLFEGTPEMMFASLRKIAALPSDTLIYCGHEYYLNNLRFAAARGLDVTAEAQAANARRAAGLPTVPTTIADELRTNVFLRAPDVASFAAVRAQKDTF